MTNGEKPSSQFLHHLGNYPVVSDAVNTYKTNPLGAKSLDIANIAYDRIAAPFLPYLRTPYSIVRPYLSKADNLADVGLNKVDETFPVVKEDTNAIRGTVIEYALFPLRLVGDTKSYVFDTYADEHKKVHGEGLVRSAKAMVSTELKIAFDALNYASSFFAQRKEEGKQMGNQVLQKAGQTSDQVKQTASHLTEQGMNQANHLTEQGMKQANQLTDQAMHQANQATEQASQKADQTATQVRQKADQKTEQAKQKTDQAKQKADQKAGY